MAEPHERLLKARKRAGYETATAAAKAFGWGVSTYLSHENGIRSFKTKTAKQYARAFRTTDTWLLLGKGPESETPRTIPVVGFVGAGASVTFFEGDISSGVLDEIEAPADEADTVAVVVRGDSMWPAFHNGDVIFYRTEHRPPKEMVGRECIVRLADGRTLVKMLMRSALPGRFTLNSYNAPPIEDVTIDWVVPVVWIKRA